MKGKGTIQLENEYKHKIDNEMKGKLTDEQQKMFIAAHEANKRVAVAQTGGLTPLAKTDENTTPPIPTVIIVEDPVYVQKIKTFINKYGWIFILLSFLLILLKTISVINGVFGKSGSRS